MIKRYRTLALLGLLIPAVAICIVNALYLAKLRHDAGQGRWIEEPIAKTYLAAAADGPEYVFIGSSRTQNHINTLLLERLGIKALNLGMAGRTWEYYPHIIREAARGSVRAIVISIPADQLFEPVSCPESYYYQLHLDASRDDALACFTPDGMTWDRLLQELPMNRFLVALEQVAPEEENARQLASLRETYGYEADKDGRTINYIRGKLDRSVVTYGNGDGQVFSHRVKYGGRTDRTRNDRSRRGFYPEAIDYMADLSRLAAKHGTSFIFIIEPAHVGTVDLIDLDGLQAALPEGVVVFDNAAADYPRELWADRAHFNLEGSYRYTKQIYSQLQQAASSRHHASMPIQ